MLNVPVNNFSVMLGRSHRFLDITSTVCFVVFCLFVVVVFFLGGGAPGHRAPNCEGPSTIIFAVEIFLNIQ